MPFFEPGPDAGKPPANATLAYVGTYTQGKSGSKGIYLYWLKTEHLEVPQNITMVPAGLAGESLNPSFLILDAKRRLLFAVNETDQFQGKPTGAVSAFSIAPGTHMLTLINQQPSMGTGPCHLALDGTGRNLLVANYNSGSVAVLPVAPDGRLSPASCVMQHSGRSVNPQRQRGPHAHCAVLDHANRFAFVCDLGVDKVFIYRFDPQQGKLTPNEPAFAAVKPGSGPRHLTFRPDGRFAYVINEMGSSITVFGYDLQAGKLTEVQTVSSLPQHFEGQNTAAEVAVHPSGKFLYASNRGHNSVALFQIDAGKGTLTWVEEQGTGGRTPRHFGLDPSARHMVIANQDSDTLLACSVDAGNGRLKPSGVTAAAPSPVCVQFLPPA